MLQLSQKHFDGFARRHHQSAQAGKRGMAGPGLMTTEAQGMNLPGWGLHLLKGRELKGHISAWVSGNWRLTFIVEGTDAVLVNYLDYHWSEQRRWPECSTRRIPA